MKRSSRTLSNRGGDRSPFPRAGRNVDGSMLAELGPALFIILFFGVFVVVDLISLGIAYSSCQTLNDLQLREAAKLPPALAKKEDSSAVWRR